MRKYNLDDYAKVARQAAAEGCVLLENENQVLPLTGRHKLAVFGRTQFNYYKSGTGSGGMVNTRYVVGIYEALKTAENLEINQDVRSAYEEWLVAHPFDMGQGWAQEPWFQEEMPIDFELVEKASRTSDTALVIIGRTAGEDKDNKEEAGSYLLTETERDMLEKVCKCFERTVVLLNVGNIIDMNWVKDYKPSAVMYVWQGGQEGGNGVLDVLLGNVNPSGRLSDTIASQVPDHYSNRNHGGKDFNIYAEDIYVGYRYFETFARDKVLYPFGYGLSYTEFEERLLDVKLDDNSFTFAIEVDNKGEFTGKHSVLIYASAPQGKLGKPSRILCGFAKTDLLNPGEKCLLNITVDRYFISSYDDSGITGFRSAYVLEEGVYSFFLGGDVRVAKKIWDFKIEKTMVVQQLEEAMAPVIKFERLKPVANSEGADKCFEKGTEFAPLRTISSEEKRCKRMPVQIDMTIDKGYKLFQVKEGKVSLDEFIGQFTVEELASMARGHGMSPSGVTPGIAGAFGGVTTSLKDKGLPKAGCSDGPSGIRMDCGAKAFAMPNGTCLACSFNQELSELLYEYEGMELRKNHIDTLLGPGMNIHRNPLNGRNFEYFSEDPFLTGKMAAAQLKGMHKYGVTGTIKHFACNNQEYNRSMVDTIVSERALREIYLKGFEIAVKEGKAFLVMTSYNRINNIHAAGNYDLNTTILRNEWGFSGTVMTDWWAQANEENGPSVLGHTAVMVAAGNNIFMVMPDADQPTAKDTTADGLKKGIVTVAELQRNARDICRTLLRLPSLTWMTGEKNELDEALKLVTTDDSDNMDLMQIITATDNDMFLIENMDTSKNKNNMYQIECGGGVFKLSFECCASSGNPLAQIPLSIFKETQLIKNVTLKGTDTEYRSVEIDLGPSISATMFLKFYFGQGGMSVRNVRITRIMSAEELTRKIEEWKQSGTPF